MKIALISPLATVAPHFETELELAQRHLDAGDAVDWLVCRGRLACCDFNPSRDAAACRSCTGRYVAGLKRLAGRVRQIELRSRGGALHGSPIRDASSARRVDPQRGLASPPLDLLRDVHDCEQLKQLSIGSFDIGIAVLSSLVSLCRDPRPEFAEHRSLVARLFAAAWGVWNQTRDYLRRERPDRVYVFNGRFAAARAVLRACQAEQVECWIHERGCDLQHFQLYPNHLPHDIAATQSRMRRAWDAAPRDAREALGQQWFLDRAARIERNWHSFVKQQEAGRLPADWDPQAVNLVAFTSSEDEFAAIGDCWENRLYRDQVSGLQRLIADLDRSGNRRLYIRLHPNLKQAADRAVRPLLQLAGPRVAVLHPDDPVDSYTLLRQASAAITFGSSVGIEAVYWGTPSILLGPCFYRGFRGVHEPASHAEAMRLLRDLPPPAADRSHALMYGYWFHTQGEPFRYFEATGLFSGRFKGSEVCPEPPPPPALRRRFRRARRWMGIGNKARTAEKTPV